MFDNLEKAVLRYRTNEMILMLFHIEDLRKFLIGSMESGNYFLDTEDEKFFNKKAKVMPQVWRRVIFDQLLTELEVSDLKKIISMRNTIAHEVQQFTVDLHSELKEYGKLTYFKSMYDYGALERLISYKYRLKNEWKGVCQISLRSIDFEFAEKAYTDENKKLSRRIDRLYREREKMIESVNQELANLQFKTYEEYPKNEANFRLDGSLSNRGGITCRHLLSKGLSCAAVSILMDISLKKVQYHQRKVNKST